jgi:hypothetical protein
MLGGDDGRTFYVVANHYSGCGDSDGIVLTEPVGTPHPGETALFPLTVAGCGTDVPPFAFFLWRWSP